MGLSWIKAMPSTFLNNPGYSHVRVALTPFFLSEVTLSFLGYKGNIPSASVRLLEPVRAWQSHTRKQQRVTWGGDKGE